MGGIRKKKFQSGEGAQYWTRATALRKLQLSLKDFRRLCILKGIYPREPRNRKKAQKGSTGIKILYNKKDIQFLMHEPIIWKFRETKVLGRKIGRAKAMREFGLAKKLMYTPFHINLDHIIKERYPTFVDALRDLDDCLTLCTLFSTFPSLNHIPREQMNLCRRLVLEFMHVVIEAKALRKVFISIKGYYFQVELKGQLITWIMPHHFGFEPQSKEEVDFKIMSTFVQLYIVLLGFVNFRLYHQLNLNYPPKICSFQEGCDNELVDKQALESERIAALNLPLRHFRTENEKIEELEIDTFNTEAEGKEFAEINKINKLKTLFNGTKVFLNREVPREPLVFILRCFGADVSWDKTLFVGATFDEGDETITHQIVDRPIINKQFISRYYIQPQWVFDCVNARELLPVESYFIGCVLPPHLSPFVEEDTSQHYVPEINDFVGEVSSVEKNEEIVEDTLKSHSKEEYESNEEQNIDNESLDSENESSDSETELQDISEKDRMKKKMEVSVGKIIKEDPMEIKSDKIQEFKLRERMVEKKYRALYRSMRKGQALRRRDAIILKKKKELLNKKRASVKV